VTHKVCVIIVNWNGKLFLEQCLKALMQQTVKPNEIILLDNASSDCSAAIANEFPSVRLILQNTNTGFARGNNLAIRAISSDSDWIALLNPDAFPEPQWLENLLKAAAFNPKFQMFSSQLISSSNPSLLDGSGDAYHMSGLVWRAGHGKPLSDSVHYDKEVFSPCAAAALYRHDTFIQLGGFDEDFFCYVEDVDLGFRMRLAGYKALHVPLSIVHHVGSGTTGGQHSDFALYHGHRNLVWTFVKNMPSVLFWAFLPLHILLNLVTIIWFVARGQGAVVLRAKRDACLGLPKMWRKRQAIQNMRVATVIDIWRQLNKSFIGRR
jgi:GT2 family glycosyltransferase